MNIGIFGGTFNPPHLGHLIVIENVRDQLNFDKILFIPSANPPHKNDPSLAQASSRLAMVQLAIRDRKEFEVSDIEVARGGTSYSIDTINALSGLFPGAHLSLIIGVDNLMEFGSWKSPHDILAKADLIVMSRSGFSFNDAKNEFARSAQFVNVPVIGISGTDIRRRVKLGRSIHYLVPPSVEEYIRRSGLYK